MPARRPPLDGITVIDLGQIYNGPYASLLLALAGADVIKVEPPGGEHLRGRARVEGAGAPLVLLNSNKRGITLNLKHERGRELLIDLARRTDVLVENFRPGVLDRLGVGERVLHEANQRLIFASGSGFGSSGPYRDYPAMDLTVQAIAGVMSTTGYPDQPPVKAGPAVCDFMGGIHLYGAITTALYERERTGEGATVEASMFESIYPALMSSLGLLFGGGAEGVPLRTGNRHNGLAEAPYNTYPTRDGFLAVICVGDHHWRELADAMGQPALGTDERYATRRGRVERNDEVDALVTAFTSQREKEELFQQLRGRGIPCAPVRDLDEVATDPHLRERGLLEPIDHPETGPIPGLNSPLHFLGSERATLRPAPELGEHNHDVFGGLLGLESSELESLEAEGAI